MANLLTQRTLNAPPADIQTRANGIRLDPCALGPFSHRQAFSETVQAAARASVAALNSLRRPLTIIRSVMTFVVSPVNLMIRRGSRPHITQKTREIIAPRPNQLDSPSTVVHVVGIARIAASLNDLRPNPILRRVGQAMRLGRFTARFSLKTSTTLRASAHQDRRAEDFLSTTYTSAAPSWRVLLGQCDDRPSREDAARQIPEHVVAPARTTGHVLSISRLEAFCRE